MFHDVTDIIIKDHIQQHSLLRTTIDEMQSQLDSKVSSESRLRIECERLRKERSGPIPSSSLEGKHIYQSPTIPPRNNNTKPIIIEATSSTSTALSNNNISELTSQLIFYRNKCKENEKLVMECRGEIEMLRMQLQNERISAINNNDKGQKKKRRKINPL